jgi:cysteinyl-tRNA synthetase
MDSLGILRPDFEPKATDYVDKNNPAMQRFIEDLIKRGAAYVSGGDVYFDIKKAKDYGRLSHQSLDKMESGARITPEENKRDPLDFALWKSAKEGEPAWDSPWGKGRPGWHIECSVMSSALLGDEFDIHGGGLDLIFPHHENEIAQSEGAGKKFARYWIHHGLLTINGQKMSKSLGNFVTVKKALERYDPDVLKLFFLQTLYSSPIDYSEKKMDEVTEYYRSFALLFRVYKDNFPKYGNGILQGGEKKQIEEEYCAKFDRAMDDNFNTPVALSVLNRAKSDAYSLTVNFALKDNWAKFQYFVKLIEELFSSNFGIFPSRADLENDNRLLTERVRGLREVITENIENLEVWKKEQAKQIEQLRRKKKFAEADQKKAELREKGFEVLDKKDGTTEVR